MASQKERQVEYYADGIKAPEFEINRPHGEGRMYSYLMDFKFQCFSRLLGHDFVGHSVLAICCGSGMEMEYLVRAGARVVGLDISPGCLERARIRSGRYGVDYALVQGDAEHLPFSDGAFDYVLVHDGLHHLPQPELAVREMARVGRLGVLISEPALAAVTRIPTALGLMSAYEDAGNYVNRLDTNALTSLVISLGFAKVARTRFLVKYGHPPATWWRLFDYTAVFQVARAMFMTFGVGLFGRWGNKLVLVAERGPGNQQPASSKQVPNRNSPV